MPRKLSHYDPSGKARMVDVSAKEPTRREAEASAFVALKPAVLRAEIICSGDTSISRR